MCGFANFISEGLQLVLSNRTGVTEPAAIRLNYSWGGRAQPTGFLIGLFVVHAQTLDGCLVTVHVGLLSAGQLAVRVG